VTNKTLETLLKSFKSGELKKPEFIDRMFEIHRILFDYSRRLPDTDIASIEIRDGSLVMTSRSTGVRISCNEYDKRLAPIEILNFGHYERDESAMMLQLVRDADTILDIGANVGWYSINFAKQHRQTRIHAFEPIPQTFRQLERNIQLNDCANIQTRNMGLSNREGALTFYYYASGSGNASSANLANDPSTLELSCAVTTLDSYCQNSNLQVDFIKCDVEGAELFVFQGGRETIARDKPVVFAEMLRKWSAKFNYHPNAILKLFADLGYRCFTVHGPKLQQFAVMDEATLETNFIFCHPDRWDRVASYL
jgi:FkbM family methyltransferase